MRIGIFGGTFNPPHLGHISAAKEACIQLGLDKLILIPAAVPPHKPMPAGSAVGKERLDMVKLAASELENAEVSDIELCRSGKSFTYLTIEQLRMKFPNDDIFLLMGSDMFLSFDSWKNPEYIADNVILAPFSRINGDNNSLYEKRLELEQMFGARVAQVENYPIESSSTQIRGKLEIDGEGINLNPDVLFYIKARGLYNSRFEESDMDTLLQRVEREAQPKRMAHILGCRETAEKLAEKYGCSRISAAQAALLHDITKGKEMPVQLKLCEEYGIIPDSLQRENPELIHALTAAAKAEHEYGMPEEVCSAIKRHTTGAENMSLLEKIIFIADCIEPTRSYEGVDNLRKEAFEDLDKALISAMSATVKLVNSRGQKLHPDTVKALDYLKNTRM